MEEMTKQQCRPIQNGSGDGNFAKYAAPSMQNTTNTAPPSARTMSSKPADTPTLRPNVHTIHHI